MFCSITGTEQTSTMELVEAGNNMTNENNRDLFDEGCCEEGRLEEDRQMEEPDMDLLDLDHRLFRRNLVAYRGFSLESSSSMALYCRWTIIEVFCV